MAQVKFLEKTERYTSASSSAAHEDILANRLGFGANALGGQGGSLVHVTNLNNSGAGSLRTAAGTDDTPAWICFDVSGTINLSTDIQIKSFKTIDGRGRDITLSGGALMIGGNVPAHDVIIHNLKITAVTEDGIDVQDQSYNVWIDHVSFSNAGDESLYTGSAITHTAPYGITISWNRFSGSDQMAWLVSADPSFTFDAAMTITSHHNWFEDIGIRTPLMRWAKLHSLNNFYDRGVDGAVQAWTHSQCYSENDIFRSPYAGWVPFIWVILGGSEPNGFGEYSGDNAKVVSPYLVNSNETYQEKNTGTIFNPASSYSYTPATANAALRTAITSGAGWQNVAFPT